MSQTTEVKRSDLIRVVLQFLKECGLKESFQTLQRESKTTLNIMDKRELSRMILESDWQSLLSSLNYLMPSQENLFDLYELMVDDLIDKNSFSAAAYLLKECIKSQPSLVSDNREKVLRMEYICEHPSQKALHHKPPTISRRENIISRIGKQIHQDVEEGRLLSLLTEALRYQASQGLITPQLGFSLLENKQKILETESEQFISKVEKMMRYDEETRVTCLKISNQGEYIAIGGVDGLIEIYEPLQYTLHTGLAYQADGVMLYHDHSIESMRFSQNDDMLVSIDSKGFSKLWNMQTGQLLRKIEFGSPVGCVCWGQEASHLLLGHQSIKLYGVRSCNVLKQYSSGGEGQEYLLCIQVENNKVYSFSQGGTVRVYNYQTQEQVNTSKIKGGILQVIPTFQRTAKIFSFLICGEQSLFEIDLQLGSIDKQSLQENLQYQGIALGQNYLYECIGQGKEQIVRIRQRKNSKVSSKVLQTLKLESKVQLLDLHKFRNLLLTYHEDDSLSFWRP